MLGIRSNIPILKIEKNRIEKDIQGIHKNIKINKVSTRDIMKATKVEMFDMCKKAMYTSAGVVKTESGYYVVDITERYVVSTSYIEVAFVELLLVPSAESNPFRMESILKFIKDCQTRMTFVSDETDIKLCKIYDGQQDTSYYNVNVTTKSIPRDNSYRISEKGLKKLELLLPNNLLSDFEGSNKQEKIISFLNSKE